MPLSSVDLGLGHGARVVVAMSGGVDSSVTAALLAEAGCEVVGITLQLYAQAAPRSRPGACCAGEDIYDARRVADRLGIRHYVLDYEARFRQAVIDDFADSYLRGETPIPCVRCNERVKFRDLLAVARDLGAEALATGHYVRRVAGPAGPELHRAIDGVRDQSYFLFATTREQLEFLRFPLGGMPKEQVRAHAERLGLSVAAKPDSQDICFVPDGRYTGVIERLRPGAAEPGAIVDQEGRVLGRHEGVIHFTVGQRRGLGIAGPEPLYVLAVDAARREVVVGPQAALLRDRVFVGPLAWIGSDIPAPGAERSVMARLRSSHPGAPARLERAADGSAELTLEEPEAATAPGQACVLYDGERMLGGGWITGTGQSAALTATSCGSTPANEAAAA
ncbi:MAG: tRNA 2-thiouridine(34) synthase MnmA [Rhodospirillales bacterium]|nr:tRNA 2-thiouridine(34) synthase MnmA [Rhodospirillales bacterium]MDE0378843.1 tRNA 2-thiouridine(34) synthase MnmA [Rhodospirillales bacterium]